MKKNELNIRLFRKNARYIVLAWDRLDDDSKPMIYRIIDDKNLVDISYKTETPEEMSDVKHKIKTDLTYTAFIDIRENKLNPSDDILFMVKYADISATFCVFSCSPPTEKEDSNKNVHLYIWEKVSKMWAKFDGTFKSCIYLYSEKRNIWNKFTFEHFEKAISLLDSIDKKLDNINKNK